MYQEMKKKDSAIKKKKTVSPTVNIPIQMKAGVGILQRKIVPIKSREELATFLIDEDIDKIRKYCMDKRYIISFRDAGEHTIRRLMDGAAAKGHHILEKSIKESSMGRDYIGLIPEEIRGLVGVWSDDKNKKGLDALEGLYMSRKGIKKFQLSSADLKTDEQKVSFSSLAKLLSCKSADKVSILRTIADKLRNSKSKELEYSDFITGDYDLHDVLYVQENERTRGALITPAHAVKEGLNEELNGTRRSHSEFDRIQHGPQSDYGKYISQHRSEDVVTGLLEPDVGGEQEKKIAACGPDGRWYILHNREELVEYYGKWGLNANIVWPSDEPRGLGLRIKSIDAVRAK